MSTRVAKTGYNQTRGYSQNQPKGSYSPVARHANHEVKKTKAHPLVDSCGNFLLVSASFQLCTEFWKRWLYWLSQKQTQQFKELAAWALRMLDEFQEFRTRIEEIIFQLAPADENGMAFTIFKCNYNEDTGAVHSVWYNSRNKVPEDVERENTLTLAQASADQYLDQILYRIRGVQYKLNTKAQTILDSELHQEFIELEKYFENLYDTTIAVLKEINKLESPKSHTVNSNAKTHIKSTSSESETSIHAIIVSNVKKVDDANGKSYSQVAEQSIEKSVDQQLDTLDTLEPLEPFESTTAITPKNNKSSAGLDDWSGTDYDDVAVATTTATTTATTAASVPKTTVPKTTVATPAVETKMTKAQIKKQKMAAQRAEKQREREQKDQELKAAKAEKTETQVETQSVTSSFGDPEFQLPPVSELIWVPMCLPNKDGTLVVTRVLMRKQDIAQISVASI